MGDYTLQNISDVIVSPISHTARTCKDICKSCLSKRRVGTKYQKDDIIKSIKAILWLSSAGPLHSGTPDSANILSVGVLARFVADMVFLLISNIFSILKTLGTNRYVLRSLTIFVCVILFIIQSRLLLWPPLSITNWTYAIVIVTWWS